MLVENLRQSIDDDLARGIMPMAIVANAGTTNTGAIDPLEDIGQIAFKVRHLAARRRCLRFARDTRLGVSHRCRMSLADSVIVDPHKWQVCWDNWRCRHIRPRSLIVMGNCVWGFQEPSVYLEDALVSLMESSPVVEHSMDDFGGALLGFNYGVELTSPCRGVMVWAALREIGADGMRERIEHNDMARACR